MPILSIKKRLTFNAFYILKMPYCKLEFTIWHLFI